MKQCVPVVAEEYDGELRFSIIESEITGNACVLTLGAQDDDEIVGFKIEIPIISKRLGFKSFQLIYPAGTVKVSSIGQKSDNLIATLVKYFQPAYETSDAFADDPIEIDYALQNKGAYDLNQDKIYLKLFYDEEQDEDLPKEERIHLNMNFAFNLSREVASLIETKEGYSADLVAFLMK
ncbi:MAG: hypothetical protein IJ043_06650 [Clostridia bacterium]|nr:hypothetical protein [Clostridia bacterium]